ncbi:MAG: ChaN family lipoprotein, partial [Deltaproteobacteria bacterium]|nr:ChaN family lipoprotein [Deltaproteobacteria bacterium]
EIKTYQREFEKDFKSQKLSLIKISKRKLLARILQSDVCLISDFHTFSQAQRTALRIMREIVTSHKNWCIGLELISSQYQKDLNLYQTGKISENTFLKHIQYQKEWGFPWTNYAPLFHLAIENKCPLIALNEPKTVLDSSATFRSAHSKDALLQRDRWAAGIITDLFDYAIRKKIKIKIFVLCGELHLGEKHLPYQIKKISKAFLGSALKTISIHQNIDHLYWKMSRRKKEQSADILKLTPNTFCILSSPPWAKLQSLIDWAERLPELDENDVDWLYYFKNQGQILSYFFDLQMPNYENFSIKSIDNIPFIESPQKKSTLTPNEYKIINFGIKNNHYLYISKINLAYIGTQSQNKITDLAGIHLLKRISHQNKIFEPTYEDFFRRILESAFGFLCSLIINPKRKCDLYQDYVLSTQTKQSKLELQIVKQTLKCLKLYDQINDFRWMQNPIVSFYVSRNLGQILGKKIYNAMLMEKISVELIKTIFFKKTNHKKRYLILIKLTENIILPKTKREQL